MKISSITYTQEQIKLKKPFITALREVHFAEFIRVKIVCENGVFAYGEAPATKAITGETLESISKSITQFSDLLIGCTLQEALEVLHQQKCGSSAKAAVDMAIVMLFAKAKKQTLKEYFKISDTTPIETDITISLGSTPQMLCDAKEALESGMSLLKIKFGSDIKHAIETTKSLEKELSGAKLLIDANQAWSKEETLHYLEEVKECKLELLEQPVIASDIVALKAITESSAIAILADEAVFTLKDAKDIIENYAADMINIKLMKCGGVSKAIEILEYAREKKILCMLGSMIEGPYSINITLYLAFAYRDVVKFVDLDSPLLYEQLPCELDFNYDGATISFRDQ